MARPSSEARLGAGPGSAAARKVVRVPGQSDADWQRELYQVLMSESPDHAFGPPELQRAMWAKRIAMTSAAVSAGDTLLELGCGTGVVAKAVAQRTGASVMAIDVSPACIAYAREHNADPAVTYVESALQDFMPGAQFGAATLFEVLEHVDDPAAVLRRIREWLLPGGLLILSTPNRTSLQMRLRQMPGLRQAYERATGRAANEISDGHVAEYGYAELCEMLVRAGYEIVREDGACLAIPFQQAVAPLVRSRAACSLNVASGSWVPRLALHAYVVARSPGAALPGPALSGSA